MTMKALLMSLQQLLESPEPNDPQDGEVASLMINHPKQFAAKAREWTIQYAGAKSDQPSSQTAKDDTAAAARREEEQRQAV